MEPSPIYRILWHLLSLVVVRFLLVMIELFIAVLRLWKLCTSSCLILMLVYWFYGGALSLLCFMFSLFGLFYYGQDVLLYHPYQPPSSRMFVEQPNSYIMPHENVFVTKDGVTLNMYLITQQNSFSFPTVLMINGNAGNIGHRLSMAYCLYKICHCNILMLEYRGYGRSTGKPSESGLYRDAETAIDFLHIREDIDSKKIFVFGSSLGGAVSIHVTSDPRYMMGVAGLILENTFTSLPDVVKSLFCINVPTFCYKNQYFSEYKIGKISIPTLFLSGQNDELIPPAMMQSLYNLSGSKEKKLVLFEGGTHNETCLCPGYFESIAEFVYETVKMTPPKPDSKIIIENDAETV